MEGSQAPTAYNPSGQKQADQSYQDLTNIASQYAGALPGQVLPQLSGVVGNVMNDPYAAGAQSTANSVASLGSGLAQSQFGASSALAGLGGLATPLAQSIIQMGFDPQSALYNQQWQQNIDQTNAINAANGVSGTPYGAGLATQSNQNFNTNWQAAQLGRALSALGGYGSAVDAGSRAYDASSNLGVAGLTTVQNSGMQPYNTSIGISNDQLAALRAQIGGTAGAIAPALSTTSSLGNYLGLGQNATSINDQVTAQNNATQQAFISSIMSMFQPPQPPGINIGTGGGGGGGGGGMGGMGGFGNFWGMGGGAAAGGAAAAGGSAASAGAADMIGSDALLMFA